MNTKNEEAFENALTNLQHVLIARRVLASDEQVRLNWNHFNIMALVKEHGSILPSQISDELRLSRPTTSKYLKYLKAHGLISTSTSKNDHRSYTIHLTSLSKQIIQNIFKGQHDNVKLALNVLTTNEAEQFARTAVKITAALDNESLKTI
ncbi:MAG: MarR family transcriptional regulator [Dehalogenimonas sp.]|uniref:MarR family transcriptional regulator n=1 Tax=Candidatus Dehalogenimonas loeffleri TaxID=3127115 RepID=A0ABZ2J5I2_9CHLR|nr:MarR family transcriptional regulator [Dehalogenimonas sp.]